MTYDSSIDVGCVCGMQASSLQFEYGAMPYRAVTVFQDDVICAADSMSVDYGDATVMLAKFSKFAPTYSTFTLIKDHLTSSPTVLRVMHGALQVTGQ